MKTILSIAAAFTATVVYYERKAPVEVEFSLTEDREMEVGPVEACSASAALQLLRQQAHHNANQEHQLHTRLALAEALLQAGSYGQAKEECLAAKALAEELGHDTFDVRVTLAELELRTGRLQDADRNLRMLSDRMVQFRAQGKPHGGSLVWARVNRLLGGARRARGFFTEARQRYAEARAHYQEYGDQVAVSEIAVEEAEITRLESGAAEALPKLQKALAELRSHAAAGSNVQLAIARAFQSLAAAEASLGLPFELSVQELGSSASCTSPGDAVMWANVAAALTEAGDAGAASAVDKADELENVDEVSNPATAGLISHTRAIQAMDSGKVEEAVNLAKQAIELYDLAGGKKMLPKAEPLRMLAQAAEKEGRIVDAAGFLQQEMDVVAETIGLRSPRGVRVLAEISRVADLRGNINDAMGHLSGALQIRMQLAGCSDAIVRTATQQHMARAVSGSAQRALVAAQALEGPLTCEVGQP
mmetsp:Transcript_26650/g.64175  ORF Transcript_26650/g.64175 Transcript_26650/m.64175 type:complete len:477 (+) Transcript_26650:194-1624(+)